MPTEVIATQTTTPRRRRTRRRVRKVVRTVVRTRPSTRKRGRRLQKRNKMANIDPFVSCVFGPPEMVGTETGAPDGNSHKSIIVEHRACYTISPKAGDGEIAFALVPCPYGTVGLLKGTIKQAAMPLVDPTTAAGNIDGPGQVDVTTPLNFEPSFTTINGNPAISNSNTQYNLLPHSEYQKSSGALSGGGLNQSAFVSTGFRVLANVARVSYTGDSFHNSGAAAIARLAFDTDQDITADLVTASGATAYQEPRTAGIVGSRPPVSFSDISVQPGAVVLPVKCGAHLCNPPTDLKYQQWRNDWLPAYRAEDGATTFPFVGISQSKSNLAKFIPTPIPGVGDNVSYYYANGVQDGQSIVVETRTCVEYLLAFNSPVARLAKTPPPKNQQAMDVVDNIARALPVATTNESGTPWYKSFWDWYAPKQWGAMSLAWDVGAKVASTVTGGKVSWNPGKTLSGRMSNLRIMDT